MGLQKIYSCQIPMRFSPHYLAKGRPPTCRLLPQFAPAKDMCSLRRTCSGWQGFAELSKSLDPCLNSLLQSLIRQSQQPINGAIWGSAMDFTKKVATRYYNDRPRILNLSYNYFLLPNRLHTSDLLKFHHYRILPTFLQPEPVFAAEVLVANKRRSLIKLRMFLSPRLFAAEVLVANKRRSLIRLRMFPSPRLRTTQNPGQALNHEHVRMEETKKKNMARKRVCSCPEHEHDPQ
jgi:hypothetical protein